MENREESVSEDDETKKCDGDIGVKVGNKEE